MVNKNTNSYGDVYYTNPDVMEEAIGWLSKCGGIKTFGDFGAGNGDFGKMLGKVGIKCHGVDIAPRGNGGVVKGDFFETDVLDGRWSDAVGFNPPFGRGGDMALKFINHVLKANPRWMIVILPVRVWNFEGMCVVKEMLLPGNSFYTPGDNKPFCTAAQMFLLRRGDRVSASISDGLEMLPFTVKDQAKLNLEHDNILVLRKVGVYAGKQCYVISGGTACYVDHCGEVNHRMPIRTDGKGNAVGPTPWDATGHIVCERKGDTGRAGLAFLKIYLPSGKKWNFDRMLNLANAITSLCKEKDVAHGAPKSINCGIAAYMIVNCENELM